MQLDPFGRARLPGDFTRQGRIALLGEFFTAIRERRMPSEEARIFASSGALSWLECGGDLCGDFWKVTAPSGSHRTPAYLWSQTLSSRGATEDGEEGIIDGLNSSERLLP